MYFDNLLILLLVIVLYVGPYDLLHVVVNVEFLMQLFPSYLFDNLLSGTIPSSLGQLTEVFEL